jgi:hypothetical protein
MVRPRHRWIGSTKTSLREIVWGGIYWINLVPDRVQGRALIDMVTNLRVP